MRWVRGLALLLVFTGFGAVLSACEYTGEELAQATAAPGRSRPAPAPLPTADPELAKAQAENQVQLDMRLGPRPDGVVLGGSGGLGGDGFSASVAGVPSGSYTVTAACLGVTKASLVIWQPNYRGGRQQELTLDCRKATSVELDLATGPVSAHAVRMTTEQGSAAVAGFWMVPAS
jgi:hypothetical protein